MHTFVSLACAFALFGSALSQDYATPTSFKTEIIATTSVNTPIATPSSVSNVGECFYLASASESKSGYLYVGKTSGGFRYIVQDEAETQFGLSAEGKLFVKDLKQQPVGATDTIYQGIPSPDVDLLYFTTFENSSLVCSIQGTQLSCQSTQDDQTRSYLVYSNEKRRFGFTSGASSADFATAAWTVHSCDEIN